MWTLRAAVALTAIFATYTIAAAQTISSARLSIGRPGGLSENAPPCTASRCLSINRYANTLIDGFTEFQGNADGSCNFLDPGVWSSPTDIEPSKNGAAGTADISEAPVQGQTPINPMTGSICTGGDTYLYQPLYFKWTLHRNDTAASQAGPTATFTAQWQGTALGTTRDQSYQITVPVVRPKGEKSEPVGWDAASGGASATFKVTLECCAGTANNGDPNFDWSGEQIKEVMNGAPTFNSPQCSASPPNKGAFALQQGNWYRDVIGYTACLAEQARCLAVTPCRVEFHQELKIKSPADTDLVTYSTNTQGGLVYGNHVEELFPGSLTVGAVKAFRAGVWATRDLTLTWSACASNITIPPACITLTRPPPAH